jgi:hypothetical protein
VDGAIAVPGERIVLRPPSAFASGDETSSRERKKQAASTDLPAPAFLARAQSTAPLVLRPALDQSDPPKRRSEIQLGAWRSSTEARAAWERAKARAAGALDGYKPRIITTAQPKGRYFRLRVTAGGKASAFCARLVAKGVDCIPVRESH